jgi:hypothetical protein
MDQDQKQRVRRALYTPPPLFGLEIFRVASTEVEVLDMNAKPGFARVRFVTPKNALINILAKIPPEQRVEQIVVERLVLVEYLTALDASDRGA